MTTTATTETFTAVLSRKGEFYSGMRQGQVVNIDRTEYASGHATFTAWAWTETPFNEVGQMLPNGETRTVRGVSLGVQEDEFTRI